MKGMKSISPLYQGPYYKLLNELFYRYTEDALPNEKADIKNENQMSMFHVYLTAVLNAKKDLERFGIHSAKELEIALINFQTGVYKE